MAPGHTRAQALAGILQLDDQSLESAAALLDAAAGRLADRGAAVQPAVLSGVSGPGGEVQRFFAGAQTACALLADAARSSAETVSSLVDEGALVESGIASALPSGRSPASPSVVAPDRQIP